MLKKVEHLSLEERIARGEAARDRVPPSSHTGWSPSPARQDPVDPIEQQDARRDADLVPVRHGRMMSSPFTFYRGGAKIMAADLHGSPSAGLEVQLCGDAHLSNFGVFGSPERRLVFDINDFDETLPGPFEYDVKRLAASMTVAAYNNGFSKSDAKSVTRATVRSYREAMAEFAKMRTLEVWYAHLSEDELRQATGQAISALTTGTGKGGKGKAAAKEATKLQKRFEKNIGKARSRDSLQALSKLTEVVDSRYRIASVPPVVVPARELHATYGIDPEHEVRPGVNVRTPGRRQPGNRDNQQRPRWRGEKETMDVLWWILFAVVWIAIAFWPARVAGRKGHSFFGYFVFSLFFFPAALIVAYLVEDRTRSAAA